MFKSKRHPFFFLQLPHLTSIIVVNHDSEDIIPVAHPGHILLSGTVSGALIRDMVDGRLPVPMQGAKHSRVVQRGLERMEGLKHMRAWDMLREQRGDGAAMYRRGVREGDPGTGTEAQVVQRGSGFEEEDGRGEEVEREQEPVFGGGEEVEGSRLPG